MKKEVRRTNLDFEQNLGEQAWMEGHYWRKEEVKGAMMVHHDCGLIQMKQEWEVELHPLVTFQYLAG